MTHCSRDAKLDALFKARQPGQEGSLVVITERSTQGIAHIIAESTDAVELAGIGLHGQLFGGVGASPGTPTLAIHIYGRVDFVEFLADEVHGLDVVDAHEVETETVDVVFVHPVQHRLYHKLAHEGFLACCLVAAAGTIRHLAVGRHAEVIAGVGEVEVAALNVEGVVIYHVEYHPDACLVQSLHHLLELTDACLGVGGIGSIGAFGHVIVERVIAPVILWHIGA